MTSTANDNYHIEIDKKKAHIPDGWQNYDKLGWTCFGPIGINDDGFYYLDPEIEKARA